MPKKIIVAYLPVLHSGYINFFKQNPDCSTLYIIGPDIIDNYRPIQKDVRALTPEIAKEAISSLNLFDEIKIVDTDDIKKLNDTSTAIVMPDEDICQELAQKYLDRANVTFSPSFLRWDRARSNAQDPIIADLEISEDKLDKEILNKAYTEAIKSSDIWRRVGALIAKNGRITASAHNQATPNEHSSVIMGDPRNNYNKGVGIEQSIFIHAESKLIAQAAKMGVSLNGTDMYVTTFPCPVCAKLIAFSGISRLFFAEGYGMLDGAETLKIHGVKLIKVNVKPKVDDPSILIPYPEK
ncbi:hypothetical protein A3F37_02315 [Candidatus Saccharibacteria bacterium RIFCSPHIGHO2_12_FULL_41_12]|nr:MAG: hypothetical protein A3F37_02315 [Candidatus Saccharibacteria bacterium RIFCSPHIGHO2_12_FULL_41_12]